MSRRFARLLEEFFAVGDVAVGEELCVDAVAFAGLGHAGSPDVHDVFAQVFLRFRQFADDADAGFDAGLAQVVGKGVQDGVVFDDAVDIARHDGVFAVVEAARVQVGEHFVHDVGAGEEAVLQGVGALFLFLVLAVEFVVFALGVERRFVGRFFFGLGADGACRRDRRADFFL